MSLVSQIVANLAGLLSGGLPVKGFAAILKVVTGGGSLQDKALGVVKSKANASEVPLRRLNGYLGVTQRFCFHGWVWSELCLGEVFAKYTAVSGNTRPWLTTRSAP